MVKENRSKVQAPGIGSRYELEAPKAILCLLRRGTHAFWGDFGRDGKENAIVPGPLECPPSSFLN